MVLNPGQTLQNGKYTIEKELGRGRFGITYLAKRSDGERWVIKILNQSLLAGLVPDERDRRETMFWQEAVKLAKCSGTPHIVQTEMPFKEGTTVCLPMEYMDGNSLADRSHKVLQEETALEYIRQIGEALAVVHEKGLVHCDIRPANIFLKLRGNQADAILADFGLALDCDAALTRTRTQERSDGFSPIELYARGKPVGPYTDVYSLAATLYELLTGEVPVNAGDRVSTDNLVSPQVKNPDISGDTAKAILAGMKLLPDQRPQSVKDWLRQLGLGPVKSVVATPQKTDWQKWGAIFTAGGVIVAVGALVVSILAMIPSWLPVLKPDPKSHPDKSPQSSAKPTVPVSPK